MKFHPVMSSRKLTSPVWEYFDEPTEAKEKGKDVVKAQCKLCGVQFVYGGGMSSAEVIIECYPLFAGYSFGYDKDIQ